MLPLTSTSHSYSEGDQYYGPVPRWRGRAEKETNFLFWCLRRPIESLPLEEMESALNIAWETWRQWEEELHFRQYHRSLSSMRDFLESMDSVLACRRMLISSTDEVVDQLQGIFDQSLEDIPSVPPHTMLRCEPHDTFASHHVHHARAG